MKNRQFWSIIVILILQSVLIFFKLSDIKNQQDSLDNKISTNVRNIDKIENVVRQVDGKLTDYIHGIY